MKKALYIVVGIIILVDMIYGFINHQEIERWFGFEVNIWIHRLILTILGFYVVRGYSKEMKTKRNT